MARRNQPAHIRRAAAAITTAALLALTGCSGDGDEPDADPSSSTARAPGPPPLATHTTLGVISGKLGDKDRARVKKKTAAVVDDWLDAAYVGDGWPRPLDKAFPHFSSGAKRDARQDAALMSNQKLADRLETVEATKRRLRVDVLAVKRRAVGVTARFVLRMRLAGEVNRAEEVRGSLFLTNREGDWKVFGYDVQRGKA
ncbi:MAG: hypothetical protein M3237_10180 [Actinomycetota bacterium]|nr:hypothetical protein [Actinomycetota bacterium]